MKTGLILAVVAVGAVAFAAGRATAPGAGSATPGETPTATPSAGDQPASDAVVGHALVDTSTASAAAPPLQLLKECADTLTRTRRQLLAARSRPESTRDNADSDSFVDCLDDPRVVAACEAKLGSREERSHDEAASFAGQFATQVVGVTPEDSAWMEEYLCTVEGLREGMVEDLRALLRTHAPAEEIDAIIVAAQGERAAVLADLETALGPERYDKLRAVGGLRIMGDALQCGPAGYRGGAPVRE